MTGRYSQKAATPSPPEQIKAPRKHRSGVEGQWAGVWTSTDVEVEPEALGNVPAVLEDIVERYPEGGKGRPKRKVGRDSYATHRIVAK